jgi:hypothetical protein
MSSLPSDEITRLIITLNNKIAEVQLDKGEFIRGQQIEVPQSPQTNEQIITSLKAGVITKYSSAANSLTDENIKLIILSLDSNGAIALDCDNFIDGMQDNISETAIQQLQHVILGNAGNEYWLIVYNQNKKAASERPQRGVTTAPCVFFTLAGKAPEVNKCQKLPFVIRGIIFNCLRLTKHYASKTFENYYDPEDPRYVKTLMDEYEKALAEVTQQDECNFMQLKLQSKRSDINLDYCKIEDPSMLQKLTEKLHLSEIGLTKINDLIKEGLKEEEEEVEEGDPDTNKNIISKEKQLMKNANDMYMISKKVLFDIGSGITYSSEKFFKNYYLNEAPVPIEVQDEKQSAQNAEQQAQQQKAQETQSATEAQQALEAENQEVEKSASIFNRLKKLQNAYNVEHKDS